MQNLLRAEEGRNFSRGSHGMLFMPWACSGFVQAKNPPFDFAHGPELAEGRHEKRAVATTAFGVRNFEGKEFREWAYLPSFDTPGNFIGGTLAGNTQNRDLIVSLSRNSFSKQP